MDFSIQNFIDICAWDKTRFLIFSDNVFGSIIYYSHLLPLMGILLLVVFVFLHNRTLPVKWLFTTSILLSIWLLSDLVLWATEKPQYTMFFWSVVNMVEPMIYAGMLFFIYSFINKESISFNKKLIVLLLLLPTVLLTPTRFALVEYDLSNCYREAIEGPLVYYGYIIETILLLWILGFGLKSILKTKEERERKIIIISIIGVSFFLFSFAMGNVLGSLLTDWVIGQFGLFGIPVFLALLGYLIVRYKAFKIELVSAQVLVGAIWILVPSILFLRRIENVRMVVGITSFLIFIMGIYLYKSVKREIKQREEIQKMAEKVKSAYETEKYVNNELKRLDEVKSQFMLATQHHLRTPLTSMQGYIELLIDGIYGKVSPKVKEVLCKIQKSAKNEIRIVEELLSVSQFQMGRKIVNISSEINIETILEEIIEYLKLETADKGIYLKFEKRGDLPNVPVDHSKIKVALVNIIDNAVKYTEKGGVTVSAKKNYDKIIIAVKDTGMGIEEGESKKIFSRIFERGNTAQKKFTTGKGIGLYLSSKIIEAHNGKIWAESEGLGKGSTFFVELPLQK